MAVKTAEIRARVEPKLKKESMKVLKKLGLSESEGIRLLLKGLVIHQGIPYEFKIPNEETIRAIEDARTGRNLSKPYTDINKLFEDLNK